MVRFLLEAGADQEHKTDEMHTALMEASMDGHVEVARLLLDSGAQVQPGQQAPCSTNRKVLKSGYTDQTISFVSPKCLVVLCWPSA